MTWFTELAQKRPLGTQTEPRISAKDIICVHTMVGYLHSTDIMFKANGYGGTESHFGVGGKWGSDRSLALDGVAYQWQDTDHTADANLDGNHHVLSIETADNAPRWASEIEPWTAAQVSTIVDLCAALCVAYDIPAKLIPDTKPGRRGLAYHAQGIEPRLVDGGEKWSAIRGKECPGSVRIEQFQRTVIPQIQARLAGDDDMTPEELLKTKITLTTAAQVRAMNANVTDPALAYAIGDTFDLKHYFRWGGPGAQRLLHETRATDDKVNALTDKVDALADQLAALTTLLTTPPPPPAQ